jgi:hypothetical protein
MLVIESDKLWVDYCVARVCDVNSTELYDVYEASDSPLRAKYLGTSPSSFRRTPSRSAWKSVGVPEYGRPNTGARITPGNSANGALPITGARMTRGKNANSALPIPGLKTTETKNSGANRARIKATATKVNGDEGKRGRVSTLYIRISN